MGNVNSLRNCYYVAFTMSRLLVLFFCRFLELESSGQRSEVRLHYRTKGQQAHTEVFPYSLADDQWHKVSVAISASHVILHVDCNR